MLIQQPCQFLINFIVDASFGEQVALSKFCLEFHFIHSEGNEKNEIQRVSFAWIDVMPFVVPPYITL